jgi:hypothetical protein
VSRSDVSRGTEDGDRGAAPRENRHRQRVAAGLLGVIALATCGLLTYTNSQPHQSSLDDEEGGGSASCSGPGALTPDEAHRRTAQAFPADDLRSLAGIAQDTLARVRRGDQAGTASRATALETTWDDAESRLVARDCPTWTYVDEEIDGALAAVRAAHPDQQDESAALTRLLGTLG